MAAVGRFFGKFFGRTVGDAASFAIGGSISRTIDPALQTVENEAWSAAVKAGVTKPIGVGVLAEGVAQGQIDYAFAVAEAARSGHTKDRLDHLVAIANVGPGVSAAFELWRRGLIGETGFRRALKRIGLEQEWVDDLVKLRLGVLDPADLARGIHRGLVPDPGLLEGELPTGEGNVPAYPTYDVDALKEALAAGYDREHLGVLVGLQGNPMGTHEAAQALFRGVLTRDDYLRAVAEGNTRNEWADAILAQSRQIPTARDFIENALRGYTTLDAAIAGAARHGMSAEDATLIYQNQGRPMNIHQITTGLARGGKFQPEPGELTDPYMASIVEGSVKPAYYDLALANRYTLPGAFALRALMQSGDLTEAEGRTLLLETGWEPTLAGKVAAKWSGSHGSAAKDATAANLRAEYEGLFISREELVAALVKLGYSQHEASMLADLGDAARVKKSRDEYIGVVRKAYLAHELQAAQARADLALAGIDAAAIDHLLHFWTLTLGVSRKQLTAAQVASAYKRGTLTLAAALQDLADRGYSAEDSQALLGLAAPLLTVAQIEAAYKAGVITREAGFGQLTGQGYTAAQANELLDTAKPPDVTPP